MQERLLATVPDLDTSHVALVANPSGLLYLHSGPGGTLASLDVQSGTSTDIATSAADGQLFDYFFGVWSSPLLGDPVVAGGLHGPPYRFALARVSPTGTLTAIDLNLDVMGMTRALCQDRPNLCDIEVKADGGVRVSEIQGAFEEPRFYASADFDAANRLVRRRLLPTNSTVSIAPQLLVTPDGSHDAVALPDPQTMFSQYYIGDAAHDVPMAPATFLPADHGVGHFSADGKSLFYLVHDPISGFVQLFRVQL
jgi:hypothetical protein